MDTNLLCRNVECSWRTPKKLTGTYCMNWYTSIRIPQHLCTRSSFVCPKRHLMWSLVRSGDERWPPSLRIHWRWAYQLRRCSRAREWRSSHVLVPSSAKPAEPSWHEIWLPWPSSRLSSWRPQCVLSTILQQYLLLNR